MEKLEKINKEELEEKLKYLSSFYRISTEKFLKIVKEGKIDKTKITDIDVVLWNCLYCLLNDLPE